MRRLMSPASDDAEVSVRKLGAKVKRRKTAVQEVEQAVLLAYAGGWSLAAVRDDGLEPGEPGTDGALSQVVRGRPVGRGRRGGGNRAEGRGRVFQRRRTQHVEQHRDDVPAVSSATAGAGTRQADAPTLAGVGPGHHPQGPLPGTPNDAEKARGAGPYAHRVDLVRLDARLRLLDQGLAEYAGQVADLVGHSRTPCGRLPVAAGGRDRDILARISRSSRPHIPREALDREDLGASRRLVRHGMRSGPDRRWSVCP